MMAIGFNIFTASSEVVFLKKERERKEKKAKGNEVFKASVI